MSDDLETQKEDVAPTMDETIGNAWADIQSRNEPEAQEKEVTESASEVATSEDNALTTPPEASESISEVEPESTVRAPSSWKKEQQAKFSSLPPDIQAEIARREGDIHRGVEHYKVAAERGNTYEKAFAPFRDTIQKIGTTPEQAITGLMQTDHNLRFGSPAQKVAVIQHIIQSYGINPEWFDQQNTAQANPEIGHLQNRLQQFEAQQAQQMQDMKEREAASLNNDIAAFAAKSEHFEAVRDRMADLLQGNASKSLQEAYDTAIWADPAIRATLLAEQQKEIRSKAATKAIEAKKLSSANVRTRGVIPAQAAVGSIEDTIRSKAKELGMY
jgi:hypothetical protein